MYPFVDQVNEERSKLFIHIRCNLEKSYIDVKIYNVLHIKYKRVDRPLIFLEKKNCVCNII